MSKVNETLLVELPIETTIMLFRKASRNFGGLIELSNNSFEVKESIQRTSWSTTNPAKVRVEINSRGSKQTVVSLIASNFGFGPIQDNHCESQLGLVKNSLIVEIENYKSNQNKSNLPIKKNLTDEILNAKKLFDDGIISKEEFEKLKRNIFGNNASSAAYTGINIEVSDSIDEQEEVDPYLEYRTEKTHESKKTFKFIKTIATTIGILILIIIIINILIQIISNIGEFNSNPSKPSNTTTRSSTATQPRTTTQPSTTIEKTQSNTASEHEKVISVDEYIAMFHANSLRVKGNTYIIKGAVGSTDVLLGEFSIEIIGSGRDASVVFHLDRSMLNSLLNLQRNDIITMRGRSEGGIYLYNGSVISIEKNNPPLQLKQHYSQDELYVLLKNSKFIIHGKELNFTVRFHFIMNTYNGFLVVAGSIYEEYIYVFFNQRDREKLLNITAGDMVTFRGTFSATSGHFINSAIIN